MQLGYFRASARFYSSKYFRKRDVEHVKRLLAIDDVDLTAYTGDTTKRHRQRIRSLLGWTKVGNAARTELANHAQRYVSNQEYPKAIFAGLIDLCWKRRWVLPAYHELAEIITQSFNEIDRELLSTLERLLTSEHKEELESLLAPAKYSDDSISLLVKLKRIDRSLKVSAISESMDTLDVFREYFMELADVLDQLALSDKATDYYAKWLTKADRQQLSQFTNRYKTYLHVLAFIKHQFYLRQDFAIDILLKSVSTARHYVNREVDQSRLEMHEEQSRAIESLRAAHLSATEFANGVVEITKSSDVSPNEKYYKIEALVDSYLSQNDAAPAESIDYLDRQLSRNRRNADYFLALTMYSFRLQRRVSDVVRTVVFDDESSDPKLIAAINYFKRTDGKVGSGTPTDFLTQLEYDEVFRGDGFGIALYKALLFFHMAKAVKSGKLNLKYSYRYRSIQDYLITPGVWASSRDGILRETGLDRFADGPATLELLKQQIDERFRTVNDRYLNGLNPHMSVAWDGRCRVRTEKSNYDTHSFISSTLSQEGIVPILQLLKGIDFVCNYSGAFRHFSTKRAKMKPRKETLYAGILAHGCNIGLGKLARISTGLDVDTLRNTVNWYFTPENLRAANRRISQAISELALANNYLQHPPTLHSSSDGRKMTVNAECLHANYSFKYFGKDKGVTDYTFIDERETLFHALVFSASDREAPYVIDGLLENQSAHELIHSTDTHGFTEQVFGATFLLGIGFAPRLAKLYKHRLYAFSARRTYQKRGYPLIPSRTINRKLIISNWDDILRFMATIKVRKATASQLFKRLSSYAIDHPLYRALKEFGRIIKTQFILTYYDDFVLRMQIQKQLNRAEQANKFSSAVFFDNDQAFQDGSLFQQETAVTCKILLQNAIILWNYLKLSEKVLNTSDFGDRRRLIEAIRRGSVITWSHVNLRGEYTFTPPSANDAIFDFEKIKRLTIN